MKIDGKQIAADIRDTIKQAIATLETPPKVVVFALSEDDVTRQYTGIKERVGKELGVDVVLERLPESTTTHELVRYIEDTEVLCQGIIVQLPLPGSIDIEEVRAAIPREKDIDCLGTAAYDDFVAGTGLVMPPVIAACKEILWYHGVSVEGKRAVVIGRGRLVGAPAVVWLERQGAHVDVCDEHTSDLASYTKDADIIVLGAGHPGLLTSLMIKEGVVILDAGASEAGGKVVGDALPACEDKASLFTPVPGGIGPVAIAMLFSNLYTLATDKESH